MGYASKLIVPAQIGKGIFIDGTAFSLGCGEYKTPLAIAYLCRLLKIRDVV